MSCINLQNGRLFGSKNVFLSSIELALLIMSSLEIFNEVLLSPDENGILTIEGGIIGDNWRRHSRIFLIIRNIPSGNHALFIYKSGNADLVDSIIPINSDFDVDIDSPPPAGAPAAAPAARAASEKQDLMYIKLNYSGNEKILMELKHGTETEKFVSELFRLKENTKNISSDPNVDQWFKKYLEISPSKAEIGKV